MPYFSTPDTTKSTESEESIDQFHNKIIHDKAYERNDATLFARNLNFINC